MSRWLRNFAWLLALMMVSVACGSDDSAPATTAAPAAAETVPETAATSQPGRLAVIATTTILGDVVANVVGGDARIDVLLPPGADPHDYQISSSQAAMLYDVDLVVVNGLGLEEGLIDVLEAAEADGVHILEVAGQLDPIPFSFEDAHHGEEEGEDGGEDHGDEEEEEGEDHGDEEEEEEGHHGDTSGLDPHFWTDPLRVARAAMLIAEALEAVEPSIDWAARAEAYAATLTELDEEIQDLLAPIPHDNRKLITNHDSLGYFADRYGFEIIGAVIPGGATLADPSSAQLAELVEEIVEEGVKVIFAETIEPTALAEAVAAEAGTDVAVVELHTGSLGEPGTPTDNIVGMLRDNAKRIADALS